jgi:hypothetical protein
MNKKQYNKKLEKFNSYPDTIKPESKKAVNIHYKFQDKQNSKLGKIAHFSTNLSTCSQKCSYCYAKKAIRMYKNTRANYDNNTNVLKSSGILPDVPKNRDIIRMYVAGDMSTVKEIKAWINLASKKENRQKIFFGYTKAWINPELLPELEKLKSLNNVILRASMDKQTGYDIPKNWAGAGINNPETIKHAKKLYVCKFEKNKIKCDSCRICFRKNLSHFSIFFNMH